jgi:hypothetical protein
LPNPKSKLITSPITTTNPMEEIKITDLYQWKPYVSFMFVVDFGSNLFEALNIEKRKKITFNLKIDIYFVFSDNNCFDCLSCSTTDTNYQIDMV